jgi:hypothetical protein
MAVDTDEDLLNEVLRPLTVAYGAVDEAEEPALIPFYQLRECLGVPLEVRCNHLRIGELPD